MIVYNAIYCNNCLDIIESTHVHDFKTCKCGNVSVDGGLQYLRRSYKLPTDYGELSVHDTDNFEVVRQFAYRTGYGKPVTPDYGKFRITKLCDMTDEHVQNSIDYHRVTKGGRHWLLYLKEKLYRVENEITISDL